VDLGLEALAAQPQHVQKGLPVGVVDDLLTGVANR
jgi:hypothetical protein